MEYLYDESKTNLKICITKYKESEFDKKVILYELEITNRGNKSFFLDKRFSEFSQLNKELKKVFNDLPPIPSKTLFDISKNHEELEKRRYILEKYLRELIQRQEVLNCEPLKKFLSLDNFAPDLAVIPPKLFAKTPDFTHGVRDFIYIKEYEILIILVSDMSLASRVDSYLSNRKGEVKSSVGVLECYQCDEETFALKKLWSHSFPYQAICLFWDPLSFHIAVGLDDGSVFCGKLSKETKFNIMTEVFYQKVHEMRVMGIAIDSNNNHIISISKDKNICLTNYVEGKKFFECPITYTQLTNSFYDINSKRFITVDNSGVLLVYSLQKKTPEIKIRFETLNKLGIRGLWFEESVNRVFTGSIEDGEICVFNIESVEKESYSKIEASMKSKNKIRVLAYSNSRKEIYSGHEDGAITIWNLMSQKPIYILKDSELPITMLKVIEKKRLLISASKEKCLKVWQMPEEWKNKKLNEELDYQRQIIEKTEAMLEIHRNNEKEDDEDLKNWQL